MIALALLLAAQAAAPAGSAATPDDIVVTGRRVERLKRLRMTTRVDRRTGATTCVFKRRSGDAALDAAVCTAVLACAPRVRTVDEMRGCIAPAMDALVARGTAWQAAPGGERR